MGNLTGYTRFNRANVDILAEALRRRSLEPESINMHIPPNERLANVRKEATVTVQLSVII